MSLSSTELWQRIAAQQLASPMQCRSWAADAAEGLSASEAIDGNRTAKQLVALGKLSQFQVDVLLSGSDEPLVRRGWRIIEPVNFAPLAAADVRGVWNDWWLATKTPTSPPAWVRWLTAIDLEQENIREANPSLPLALRHSQVAGTNVQGVTPPEMIEGALQLCVSPLSGKLLTGLITDQPLPTQTVIAMLLQASAALAALHVSGIAHGRVTPDRLCVDVQGNWQLLRDPLCGATLGLKRPSLGLVGSRLPGKLTAAHFMAPEFLLPAQAATPQTDCYGLGCVAWLALTGRPPVTGKLPEQILAAHADEKLDLRQLAHVPEPLTRCIVHALAKNPQARFASALELRESLVEAQRLIEAGPEASASATVKAQPHTTPAAAVAPTKPTVTQPIAAQPIAAQAHAAAEAQSPEPAKAAASAKPSVKPVEAKPVAAEPVDAKPVPAATPADRVAASVAAATATTSSTRIASAQPAEIVPAQLVTPATAVQLQPQPQPQPQPIAAAGPQTTSDQANAAAIAPGPSVRSPGKPKPAVRSGVRRAASKRKKKNSWLVPAMGAGALVALLLLILVLNGGLGSSSPAADDNKPTSVASNAGTQTTGGASSEAVEAEPADPRLEYFELVDSSVPVLWAPPREPDRLPLDLLPPGGQLFLSLRPASLFAQPESKELLGLLDADLGPFWQWLSSEAGVPVEAIDQVTVAAYAGQSGAPQFALRVHLQSTQSLEQLKTAWGNPSETKVGEHALLISGTRGYYVAAQPLVDSQSVAEFLVGPVELAREAVELQGAVGPLTSQVEQLWQWTDRQADVSLLLAPSFLFTEGRQLVERAPERLAAHLVQWLSRDMRGVMLNTSLSDQWFYEVRLVGASDRDAGSLQQKLSDAVQQLPQDIESWFVSQTPHPHWRAIALRYPNMLRALAEQTRFGVEDGQAVANGYLPAQAAPNLLYASWIALQTSATIGIGSQAGASATASAAEQPLTPEQILDRPITVVVDVQNIEVVLQLIAEQATENLPAGTLPLRFELDGPAFQRAGFTRNQPVRDFKIEGQPVRAALTELAKLGNPVPNVGDLRSDDQKMIWVLAEVPDKPGEWMVSLTSREAAIAAKQKLPSEFAPAEQ